MVFLLPDHICIRKGVMILQKNLEGTCFIQHSIRDKEYAHVVQRLERHTNTNSSLLNAISATCIDIPLTGKTSDSTAGALKQLQHSYKPYTRR